MAKLMVQRKGGDSRANTDAFVLSELGHFQAELTRCRRVGQFLGQWRDRILEHKESLSALANATKDAISARGIEAHGPSWTEVYQLAEETKTTKPKDHRHRYLCSIVALWGSELVSYYGLESQAERQLRALRACAMKDPDFEWFPRLANMIMLRRHEHSLLNNGTASIKVNIERSRFPLKLEDLEILSEFAKGKSELNARYDRVLTPLSYEDGMEVQRVDEWASCEDGAVAVADSSLRHLYPDHYRKYLLRKDRFGIFGPLSAHRPTKKRLSEQPPVTVRFPNLKRFRPGAEELLPPRSADPPPCPRRSQNRKLLSRDVQDIKLPSALQKSVRTPHNAGPQRPPHGSSEDANPGSSQCGSPSNQHENTEKPSHELPQEVAHSSKKVVPSSLLSASESLPRSDVISDCPQKARSDEIGHIVDHPDTPSNPQIETTLSMPNKASPQRSGDSADTGSASDIAKCHRAHMVPEPGLEKTTRGAGIETPAHQCAGFISNHSAHQPHVDCERGSETQSSEERHPEFIHPPDLSVDAVKVLSQWNRLIRDTARGAPHPILENWINPVRFASILHAHSPESFHKASQPHDILELGSETFKTLIQKDAIFNTPLIVREEFSDSGDYSLSAYTEILARTFPGGFLNVRCHQGPPERTPISTVVKMMQSEQSAIPLNGPNLLDLADLTNSIKPSLTRLPRLRLLDRINQNAKAHATDRYGKQETLTPFDIGGSGSFEIFGFRGAFSGAHLDVLGGTWLRNLFGIKLWMFIPENLMTDTDWTDFARDGPEWNPTDKSRAIILQPGDVFVMPPGVRVIHAVHTLETCLMNGGMFWDERTIVPTLHAVRWICCNQNATNEPIPYQLSNTLSQLDTMVEHYPSPHVWCAEASSVQRAVSEIRALGCRCKTSRRSCDKQRCPCYSGSRRCTPMCNSHAMLRQMPLCMVDPAE